MKDYMALFEEAHKQARNANYVHHYTTLTTLELVLKNRSLLLNRIDKVNDLMEHQRMDAYLDKKAFVACFTHRQLESYFFWKAYLHKNKNEIGVRISFPIDILEQKSFYFDSECKKHIPLIERTDTEYKNNGTEDDWGLRRFIYANMIYTSDFSEFCYEDGDLKNFYRDCVTIDNSNFEYNALPCLVKSCEWDSEEETRMVALVRPKWFEAILGKTAFDKHTYTQPEFDKIYLNLSEDILGKCLFTLSPFCSEEYQNVSNTIRSYDITKTCNINKSVMLIRE